MYGRVFIDLQRIPPSAISLSPKSRVIHHKSEITSPNVTSHWSIVGFHKNMIRISQQICNTPLLHVCTKTSTKPQIISRMRRDKSEVASQKASICFHTQSDTPFIQILGHCLAMPPQYGSYLR